MLVRGAARSPDIDEFALFLQPVADGRRDCRSRTVKLIHLQEPIRDDEIIGEPAVLTKLYYRSVSVPPLETKIHEG